MTPMQFLRSPRVAFVTMAFLVACGIVFGYRYFGWLGVLLVGCLGLLISMRAEIFDAYGDPHERAAANVVEMYARQMGNRRFDNGDANVRRHENEWRRHVFHRVINAVFTAISLLGGSMFVLKEL